MKAVVLLSGGLDSATCLAWALGQSYECYALTVDYGQRHDREIVSAARIARHYGVDHRTVRVPLGDLAQSALTGTGEVPKNRTDAEIGVGIPPTYVPARNTVLLALALAWADTLGAEHLVVGCNVLDHSGYPDCRREFLDAFARAGELGTRLDAVMVHAPLIEMTKAQILAEARALSVPVADTWSCYDPDGARPCGRCDACLLRERGRTEA